MTTTETDALAIFGRQTGGNLTRVLIHAAELEDEPGTWELISTVFGVAGRPGPGSLLSPDFSSREAAVAGLEAVVKRARYVNRIK